MTFATMRTEVELLYESINSSAAPGFTSTEWGILLTVAQRRVVLNILKAGVEKSAFNQLSIEKLIQADSYTSFSAETHFKNSSGTAAQKLNVATKIFDSKFFWILDEYVTTASKSNIPIIKITFDYYRKNIDNPFRKPDADEDGYWMLQYNNTPVFITDGTAVTGYYIVGVHHPDNYPISSIANCVLNESVHSDIVKEAVTLARMSISDVQGYQLAVAESAKQ